MQTPLRLSTRFRRHKIFAVKDQKKKIFKFLEIPMQIYFFFVVVNVRIKLSYDAGTHIGHLTS